MNIWLIVDYEPIPGIDGPCRYLRYGTLASTLACNGHKVTWWTSDFDHAHKQHRDVPAEIEILPNLTARILHGTGYGRNISIERVRHNRSVARSFTAMHRMLLDRRPDIVIACLHTLELAEAAAAFAALQDIPFVVDVVDIWPEVYLRAFPQALKSVARKCLHSEYSRAKRILRSAQTITAVSRTYLEWALRLCPDAPGRLGAVFPLGYDDAEVDDIAVHTESERLRTTFHISPDSLNLAFVGQLSHSYDLDVVIGTARLLYPSLGENLRFFIAGDGIDSQRLRATAQTIPSIAFTGWLSHAGVVALLKQCTVGLASYANGATQSLPYKPFEYMASGLALLSCLPGELAEMIRKEGIGMQYVAGSAESLAERIRELVNNPENCAAMRRRSRALFEAEYQSSKIYRRFADYLETVAGGQAHHVSLSLT